MQANEQHHLLNTLFPQRNTVKPQLLILLFFNHHLAIKHTNLVLFMLY